MLRLGEGGGPVVVVHDQVGCPTYTGHLADGLVRLIDADVFGIHHMAGGGSCSWYEFAMEIFRQSEVVTRVMASTTDMMERPAKRPANSVLGSGRSAPITLPDWQRGLADYLDRRERPDDPGGGPRPPRRLPDLPPAGARLRSSKDEESRGRGRADRGLAEEDGE